MSIENIKERIVNNLLLLYLIDKTNKEGYLEDNLKLQKLAFLTQKKFIERRLKGFSYNFFRWHKGPFSADVNNDLVLLKQMNFARWEDRIYLTEEGEALLKQCEDLFERNDTFLQIIDSIIKEYAGLKPDEIKEKVYEMKVMVPKIRKSMLIREIPPKTLILYRPSKKRTRQEFDINEEWLATLELIFDEEALELLKKAFGDAINGKVHEIAI